MILGNVVPELPANIFPSWPYTQPNICPYLALIGVSLDLDLTPVKGADPKTMDSAFVHLGQFTQQAAADSVCLDFSKLTSPGALLQLGFLSAKAKEVIGPTSVYTHASATCRFILKTR